MPRNKSDLLITLLLVSITILLVTNLFLFLRVNQLQEAVLSALKPFQRPAGLKAGGKAPEFELLDINGNRISLQKVIGASDENKKILVVFSSPSCPACQAFWPTLNQLHNALTDLEVIMISKGSATENKNIQAEQGFDFPVLLWDEKVAYDYKVPGTPFLYLISRNQIIEFSGFADEIYEIDQILGK